MKKYILRCPEIEIPNQEILVSIFLESRINKKLHAALYPMKHKTLAASTKDAIELDDNCDEFKDGKIASVGEVGSQKSAKTKVIV